MISAIANIGGMILGRIDERRLAKLARGVPAPLMRAAVLPPVRGAVIAEIFRRMPAQVKEAAKRTDAVIKWDVADERRTDTRYLVIADGHCSIRKAIDEGVVPRVTFGFTPLDFIRMATGSLQPMAAYQQGKVKISGDLWFAAQVSSMFEIPA